VSSPEGLADLGVAELVAGFGAGTLSPVDVVDAVLARIDRLEPLVQALYLLDPDAARSAAQASEARWAAGEAIGPLDGVPVTVKENIATRGAPVPLGSAGTPLVPAAQDAPPAARLREAGAVLLAKTTMPDFGMLSSGTSSFHPLTRNPWGLGWTAGGSSAGAAAAAAAGFGPLHVGTDIGGSLRLPAGWTAPVTLKPSLGRVPIVPPFHGRVAGPMTRTVDDAARLMAVLAQPDWRDGTSLPAQDLDWTSLDLDVRGLRVGLHLDAGCGLPVDPAVEAAVRSAADVFAGAGAHVTELAPFFTREMLDDLDLFWRVRGWVDLQALPEERRPLVLPFIVEWCRGGAGVSGEVVLRCVNRMFAVRAAAIAATHPFDVVLSPVCPIPAFPAELPSPTDDVDRPLEHIAFTVPYNFSEQPASSINCGFTADGRPIGLQIAGRRHDDLGVLRATRWFEDARPTSARPSWPDPGRTGS
jgi:aspartyl-tRNA(Asn)/glutamyl-tRNA(Gln) amidotransferase subunit A